MNTLKNAALLIVMGSALYFVYVMLNKPQGHSMTQVRHQHESLAPPAVEFAPAATIQQPITQPPPLFPSNSNPPVMQPLAVQSLGAPTIESNNISAAGHQAPLPQVDIPANPSINVAPSIESSNPLRSTYEAAAAPIMEPAQPAAGNRRSAYESPANVSNVNYESPPVAPELPVNPLKSAPVTITPNRAPERNPRLAARSLMLDFEKAEEAARGNRFREALSILTPHFNNNDISSEDQEVLYRWLDALAAKVIYSPEHLLSEAYKITSHDTLLTIGERYQVSWALLQNVNNVRDPQVLVAGTYLKMIPGPFSADVDLSRKQLTLFVQQLYAGRFPFTLGDEPPTPGEYTVRDKRLDRAYYGRDGRMIPANDPSNPYGGFWIDLGSQVSLHGSSMSGNARTANLGCVSLSPQDARDVFSILNPNSLVVIRR